MCNHTIFNFNFRQLDHLNSRLSHDISSIFAILTDNTYQHPSLIPKNAHLLGHEDIVKPSPDLEQSDSAYDSAAKDSVPMLPKHADVTTSIACSESILRTTDHSVSKSSAPTSKPRSSSAINISCQTPQSTQSKRASSSSGAHRDFFPGSQVDCTYLFLY